ncbi:phosphatase PAP2 family protein [Rossellomorea marisflavi]|uniref:acid phosphatase n=1 Tax=Rossellomorea marisflavi TaxID=189381 RepID=UPI00279B1033|nr:phosphatase PAP2 family protein [Rossellomorea marisflavi]UTE71831.1 phosphatase PAP2 family protein [Rossellomorea marisflavi]
MKAIKPISAVVLSLVISQSALGGVQAGAKQGVDPVPEPPSGYFIDTYKNNVSGNKTTSNPTISVLSQYNRIWQPGETWDSGVVLDQSVHEHNIQTVLDKTSSRTNAQADAAYLDDRVSQSYSALDGLGSLTDIYRRDANATTTITGIPQDALTKKYTDEGTGAGTTDSELGQMAGLVETLRGEYSSTSSAKDYYSYKRPFRWTDPSIVVPELRPTLKEDPTNDGGFPSGHTNAAYLTALAIAYAVPERYQEMLTRASELGDNRLVAGVHSPLDVMGGRTMATALAASILTDPDNETLKEGAYEEAHTKLLTQDGNAPDRFADKEANKQAYMKRLTYGFKPTGSTKKPMVVPKGAEVLLETRLPYLSDEDRRRVLSTTGLASGYPLLDDLEGWGRLNLYAAADGFGSFETDVKVKMDASKGGFHAEDTWANDISGKGSLTKKGSGELTLTGDNSFRGDTTLDGGTLVAGSKTALGKGDVEVETGTLQKESKGKLVIDGDYSQSKKSVLEVDVDSREDVLVIKGDAELGGTLKVHFPSDHRPGKSVTVMTYGKLDRHKVFNHIETTGLPKGTKVKTIYKAHSLELKLIK